MAMRSMSLKCLASNLMSCQSAPAVQMTPVNPLPARTNRMELAPFVLKLADRVIAGQVLNDNDKPASGVNVQLNGEGHGLACGKN